MPGVGHSVIDAAAADMKAEAERAKLHAYQQIANEKRFWKRQALRIGTFLGLPFAPQAPTNRSLFIFAEDNNVRKYARILIDWGYPRRPRPHTGLICSY